MLADGTREDVSCSVARSSAMQTGDDDIGRNDEHAFTRFAEPESIALPMLDGLLRS